VPETYLQEKTQKVKALQRVFKSVKSTTERRANRGGAPTLPKAPSSHAVLITPVDRNRCSHRLLAYRVWAFPQYRVGRHQRLSFRGLLKVDSCYGPPGCCSLKADICPQSSSRKLSLLHCLGSDRDEPIISGAELASAGSLNLRGAPTCGLHVAAGKIVSINYFNVEIKRLCFYL
jgi:hypothetical protein